MHVNRLPGLNLKERTMKKSSIVVLNLVGVAVITTLTIIVQYLPYVQPDEFQYS
ncbi:MAG: hypothetical protein JWQ85_1996 [Mucilaginibacter sp.]|nr:hypothetical protein [Mucilaginibacter sp.]